MGFDLKVGDKIKLNKDGVGYLKDALFDKLSKIEIEKHRRYWVSAR